MKVTRIIFAIVVFSAAVLVGTATAEPTPLGLKAWGERLQGEARVYSSSSSCTRRPALVRRPRPWRSTSSTRT